MSKHPLYANPTADQQREFDEAVQRCQAKCVDPFELVSVGPRVCDDGSTLDVDQLKSRWMIEARNKESE